MVRAPVSFLLLVLLAACGEPEIGGVPAREWDPSRCSADEIRAAVTDDDPWVRRLAVAEIVRRRPDARSTVPALILAIDDAEPSVREAAALALGRYRTAAAPAVDGLVRLVEGDRTSVGRMAAWALGEIGKPAREAATAVLERYGHEDALRRLQLSLPTLDRAQRQRFVEPETIVVSMDSALRIRVGRSTVEFAGLARRLQDIADRSRRDEPPAHPSRVWAYLALDEDLPWIAAKALLSVCASPDIRLDRIQFAVRRVEDGRLGVLKPGIPLREIIERQADLVPAEPWPRLAVVHLGRGGRLRPADLADPIARLRKAGSTVSLRFRAEDGVTIRDVLRNLAEIEHPGAEPALDGFFVPAVWNGAGDLPDLVRKARTAPVTDPRIRWEEPR